MRYPRLSIRRTVYRGEPGFGIYGRLSETGWPVRVFVKGEDRAYAERVRDRVIRREDNIFD